jgi:hypothetical protein
MQDRNQYARTDEGDNNATPEPKRGTWEQKVCQEATKEGANETHDDVPNDAVATATHHHASQEASNQADN